MKFGKKQTTAEKMAVVNARLGKTAGASKGTAPAPKATVKVRPMGGLKPHGVKIKIERRF